MSSSLRGEEASAIWVDVTEGRGKTKPLVRLVNCFSNAVGQDGAAGYLCSILETYFSIPVK